MVSSKLARLILDDARDEAKVVNGRTLRQQLRCYETDARKALAAGSISILSLNGRHQAFAQSGRSSVSLVDLADCYRRLVDVHDQSATDLAVTAQQLGDGSQDDAIVAQMKTYLREVVGYTNNWQYLSK